MIPDRLRVEVQQINQKVSENVYKLVSRGENAYIEQVKDAASEIKAKNCRIVLITGPSGAGKTTTSYKLKQELENLSTKVYVINMDDFFKDLIDVPLREDGEPDIEGICALDVECVKTCLNDLLTKLKTKIPSYDFETNKRKQEWRDVKLNGDEIVIMEGIHALNPQIYNGLDLDKIYKIYVHCNTDFVVENTVVLEARELRLLRRIVRDERTRHISLAETLEMWTHVNEGEEKNIRPFKEEADFFLNSTHFYEPHLYKSLLLNRFEDIDDEHSMIKKLLVKFKLFSFVDERFVPENSLLREFIGEKK
ncbi:MAG: hypothetical protein IJD48_03160 [Clostridia bacterium]|nr:hypothetical protein [Clostridia bacterium]